MVGERAVEAKAERRAACECQRNVVSRQVDALEPIVFLEVAEAVVLFSAIREVRVHQVGDFTFGA